MSVPSASSDRTIASAPVIRSGRCTWDRLAIAAGEGGTEDVVFVIFVEAATTSSSLIVHGCCCPNLDKGLVTWSRSNTNTQLC
ncbi:hypothetical protein [Corynebacterium silvaticum]|uniref:hypothetical protein n=1 Tax=Corynebacterium silvaticum TaxID=2320431 RepID=UPI0014192BA0|nr:hypothetical protein [Corynebacterium silvaticum]